MGLSPFTLFVPLTATSNLECALKIKTAGLWKNVLRTNNDFAGLHLSFATHLYRRVNKTEYCVRFMWHSSWLPAISQKIEKTLKENYVWTYLFLFPSLCVALSLSNVPKTVFWVNLNGGHKHPLGGHGPPGYPVVTALAWGLQTLILEFLIWNFVIGGHKSVNR